MMMWGATSPSAKLTDDSGSAFEAPLIGDCRLFRSLAGNQPPRLLGLLQQYRREADVGAAMDSVTIKSGRSVQLGRTKEGKQTQAFGRPKICLPTK
jgi:hypothetical protein